jgi:hypothetical protein
MRRSDIVIVTPALADANNGNWQTARRWADMLSQAYRVRLAAGWDRGDEALKKGELGDAGHAQIIATTTQLNTPGPELAAPGGVLSNLLLT